MAEHDDRVFSDLPGGEATLAEYATRLAAIAEKHLSVMLRSRLDGEDIAQSAMRTFCRRFQSGEFVIDGKAELWSLLCHITIRKARRHARFHGAAKRNARTERWLDDATTPQIVPSHEDVVIVNDLLERILLDLPEKYGEIVGLLLEGHSKTEVAAEAGLSRMSIHRIVDLVKERLQKEMELHS